MRFFLRNKELVAGAVGAAALLTAVFLAGAPAWVGFVAGVAVFLGLYLIGSHWFDLVIQSQAMGLTENTIMTKIEAGRAKLRVIYEYGNQIPDAVVREQVLRICHLAQKIFDNFADDPGDVVKAPRFLLYLERFLPSVERYARLSSTSAGRELLQKTGGDKEFREMLDVMEQGFGQGYQNYLKNDMSELSTLSRVLKRMMSEAEVGK